MSDHINDTHLVSTFSERNITAQSLWGCVHLSDLPGVSVSEEGIKLVDISDPICGPSFAVFILAAVRGVGEMQRNVNSESEFQASIPLWSENLGPRGDHL